MGVILGAAAIAGGGALLGGVASGIGAASAASTAAEANKQNTAATNAANLNLFNLGRGAVNPLTGYGNAVLPEYFGANEQASANQAYTQFQNLNTAAQGANGQLQQGVNYLGGAATNSLQAIAGMYNGQNLNAQLGFAQPVYNANSNLAAITGQGLRNTAQANYNGVQTGLAATIAQMNAQNAANGFIGSSSFNNNRLASATIQAQQAGATGLAQANAQANNLGAQAQLQNLQNTQQLQAANLSGMTNFAPLAQGAAGYGQMLSAPITQGSQNFQNAQAALNFYRIAPQSFQQQNSPTVYPGVNAGQILGGAITNGSAAYGNYQTLNTLLNSNAGAGGIQTSPYGGVNAGGAYSYAPAGYDPAANGYSASGVFGG